MSSDENRELMWLSYHVVESFHRFMGTLEHVDLKEVKGTCDKDQYALYKAACNHLKQVIESQEEKNG